MSGEHITSSSILTVIENCVKIPTTILSRPVKLKLIKLAADSTQWKDVMWRHVASSMLKVNTGFSRLLEILEKPGIYFGSLNHGNSLEFCVKTLNPLENCERHKK